MQSVNTYKEISSEEQKSKIGSRHPEIDLLRIIACFLVIVNHSNSRIFSSLEPSVPWLISITYFFVSKCAVPIFIMITGYLLLKKEESYKKWLIRIGRILSCLLLFSFLYYCVNLEGDFFSAFSIRDFLKGIYSKPITTAYWYIYLYIGILLMLPFLQKLAKEMEKKDFYVFFLISAVVNGIWPILVHYFPDLKYSSYFEVPIFGSYICMLFLGAFFERYYKKDKRIFCVSIVAWFLILIFNVVATYFEYIACGGEKYLFFEKRTLFPIIASAVCVFYIVSYFKETWSEKTKRIISYIGKNTFGIYLLTDLLIKKLIWIYSDLNAIMPSILAMVIFEIVVFLSGLIITSVLKRVPIIKQII